VRARRHRALPSARGWATVRSDPRDDAPGVRRRRADGARHHHRRGGRRCGTRVRQRVTVRLRPDAVGREDARVVAGPWHAPLQERARTTRLAGESGDRAAPSGGRRRHHAALDADGRERSGDRPGHERPAAARRAAHVHRRRL
jgi:hypothetical protein